MKYHAFVEALRMESLGFAFGEPWRPSDKAITCVLPVIRDHKGNPTYKILAKAAVKITDTGSINRVKIQNKDDLPVFIRTGELFKGATQERSATISMIVMPGDTVDIPVVCVHASRGIRAGSEFTSYGYVPGNRESYFMDSNIKGFSPNQAHSWAEDRNYVHTMCCAAGEIPSGSIDPGIWGQFTNTGTYKPDDITTAREEATKLFKDLIAKVPLIHNQIGMALIDDKGFHSLDCYDLHTSWKDVKEAIVGKEVLSLSQTDKKKTFTYNPEVAVEEIKQVLGSGFTEKVIISQDGFKTIGMENKNYIGEIVSLNDEVIHMLLCRKWLWNI